MADYAAMYHLLFDQTTRAIDILMEAQQDANEIYLASRPAIKLFDPDPEELDEGDDEEEDKEEDK